MGGSARADSLARAAIAALCYLVAARYSLALQDLSGIGALYWPAAGVTVTALVVSPRRSWLWILVAVGFAELGNDLLQGFGLAPSLVWAAANMVVGLVAAQLITRWKADDLADVRRTVQFVLAAIAGSTIGAVLGAVGTSIHGLEMSYGVLVAQWIVGDSLGIITLAPVGLVVLGRIPAAPLRSLEALGALMAVTVCSLLLVSVPNAQLATSLNYLLLLPLAWAAARSRMAGAATAIFIAGQITTIGTALGRGPFAGAASSELQASTLLQLFLGTVGVTVLLLAARTVESERYRDLAAVREQLVASVSHELRTPLTPVIGFSETLLARQDLDDPAMRSALQAIRRNGRHLSALIDDLLLANQADRDDLRITPSFIELSPFLDTLLGDRGDEEVTVALPDNHHRGRAVWADETHLRQILTNLLDNARRHGRPPVRVTLSGDDLTSHLAVTDAGDGVAAGFAKEMFEDFSRGEPDPQSSEPGLGLGIGLPLARKLAIANGGNLTYRARGEHAFVVSLPASQPAVLDV